MSSSSLVALPSYFSLINRLKQQKQALKSQIHEYIKLLESNIEQEQKFLGSSDDNSKQMEEMKQKISILKERLKLIDKCEQFSIHRLNHLEEIFKYYCSHIFKIGKHMTFDRLEYEREHLNIERFFLFLKDFNLTVMQLEGKSKEIISKQSIMTTFKKISSNSRDFTFEEFIKCLEKIAILYYDEKSNYWSKIEEEKLEKIKRRKEIEKRKIKRMKLNGQKVDENTQKQLKRLQKEEREIQNSKNIENFQNSDQQQKQEQQLKPKESSHPLNQESQPHEQNNQNDDLVREMMEDKDLQDPNEEINHVVNQKKLELIQIQKSKKNQQQYERSLLGLTNNEKIEFFYQMIGVDSVKQYKNKLTVLNMPLFHKDSKETPKGNDSRQIKTITTDQSANNPVDRLKSQEDQQRLIKLKQKMNEKKQKLKNQPIPKPKELQETQTARKRRQMKEERQLRQVEKLKEKQHQNDALKQKNKDHKKNGKITPQQNLNPQSGKPAFNEKQINWAMLEKMNFEQLKLRQFNPAKLYHADEDDYLFMQEYGEYKVLSRSRADRIQARQRQSLSIVQNAKKRINEVEKSQRKQQQKLNNKIILPPARGSIKGKF